jgi:hypothetical protein
MGLYLDSMFLLTLSGVLVVGALGYWSPWKAGTRTSVDVSSGSKPPFWKITVGLVLIVGFVGGLAPRFIGLYLEPHDAYREQFSWSLEPRSLAEHVRILTLECLPRLLAGHRLPGFESDPDPALLGSGAPIQRSSPGRQAPGWRGPVVTFLAFALFMASLLSLGKIAAAGHNKLKRTISCGLLVTALSVVTAFLLNRNIFNSDNYRYLVLLLIPWSLGFGLYFDWISGLAGSLRWIGPVTVVGFGVLFTADAAAWYRRLGWVDERYLPRRQHLEDPALAWLEQHPEIRNIQGSYWDVYRLAFLTGGRVRGVPFPIFPDRFPEWSRSLPGGHADAIIARSSPEGQSFLNLAVKDGGRILHRSRGLTILSWPQPGRNTPAEPE